MTKAQAAAGGMVALVATIPDLADARGGGGGHFGGGFGHVYGGGYGHVYGGGYGHVYGGGYGYAPGSGAQPGSELALWLIILTIVAIAVVSKMYLCRSTASRVPSWAPEDSLAVGDTQAFMRGLKHADAHFDAESFLERAEMTYMLLARARAKQVSEDVALLVTPNLAARLAAEISTLREHRQVLRFDNMHIRRSGIESVGMLPTRDQIVVHFDVVYAQVTIDSDTGKRIHGSGEDRRFGERWTFMRKAGTQTALNGGVLLKICARCGAPLAAENFGVCAHCDAKIALGEVDWTVDSIEHVSFETQDRFRPVVEMTSFENGSRSIGIADPQFVPAHFLERAKLMFFAMQDAWQSRNLEKGCAYISQTLYVMWSTQIENMISGGRRNILEHLEIRQITPLHIERGALFDLITVLFEATCADYEVEDASGKVVFGNHTPHTFKERWTFKRSTGVTTVARGIAEAACPNCGADLAVNNIGVCRHCDVVITNGRFDWVISRITQEDEPNPVGNMLAALTPFANMASIRESAELNASNTTDPLL